MTTAAGGKEGRKEGTKGRKEGPGLDQVWTRSESVLVQIREPELFHFSSDNVPCDGLQGSVQRTLNGGERPPEGTDSRRNRLQKEPTPEGTDSRRNRLQKEPTPEGTDSRRNRLQKEPTPEGTDSRRNRLQQTK
ncbi:uncharacterized protein V6R79_014610 [Siganus canaliculatus]